MSKILITGANGFIGSFLVEEALNQGYEVFAAVRNGSNLQYLRDSRINIITIDISDYEELVRNWQQLKLNVKAFDYVIHNAGATQLVNNEDFDKINYQLTQNLLLSFINANFIPKKFIFVSSLAAHGPGNSRSLAPIEPNDVPNPLTHYGRSKLKAEKYLNSQEHVPFLIFRPTAVYGPRDKDFLTIFRLLNWHFEPYISSPEQRLSFVYVKDLAHLLISSCSSTITNKTFLVSDGENYLCKEFIGISKKIMGKKTIPLVFPNFLSRIIVSVSERIAKLRRRVSSLNSDKYKELISINWSCNSDHTQKVFEFAPEYNLQKGIKETIKWYRKNKLL